MKLYNAVLVSLIFFCSTASQAEEKIRFLCGLDANSNYYKAYSGLYKKAFGNLGYEFEMLQRPSRRVAIDVAAGLGDGDCGRVGNLSELTQLDSLVRVNANVARVDASIWSYNPSIDLITKEDLTSGVYRIGIMRGGVLLEHQLKLMMVKFEEIETPEMGLKMLYAGRIDLLLAPSLRVNAVLEREQAIQAPNNVGRFMALEIYPYLSKNQEHLAIPLAKELNKMLVDPSHNIHKYSGLLSKK